jgi:hypothetical protein
MKHLLFLCLVFSTTVSAQWDADSLGNHRAVVEVTKPGPGSWAVIEWRRMDDPANKQVMVVDARTNQRVMNVLVNSISREKGTVVFEPVSGPGTYYIYYMPYKVTARSNYPQAVYYKPANTASPGWATKASTYPPAKVIKLESINEINSFYPMQVIATAKETLQIAKGKPYLVFPESREYPIKMKHDLPQRWIQKGITDKFSATALRGENFSYQLGIYAANNN